MLRKIKIKPTKPSFYAQTTVSVEKSQGQIKNLLYQFGATSVVFSSQRAPTHMLGVFFTMPTEDGGPDQPFTISWNVRVVQSKHSSRKPYGELAEKAERIGMRSVYNLIKAKLDAVASEAKAFELEFLDGYQIETQFGVMSIGQAFTSNTLLLEAPKE